MLCFKRMVGGWEGALARSSECKRSVFFWAKWLNEHEVCWVLFQGLQVDDSNKLTTNAWEMNAWAKAQFPLPEEHCMWCDPKDSPSLFYLSISYTLQNQWARYWVESGLALKSECEDYCLALTQLLTIQVLEVLHEPGSARLWDNQAVGIGVLIGKGRDIFLFYSHTHTRIYCAVVSFFDFWVGFISSFTSQKVEKSTVYIHIIYL